MRVASLEIVGAYPPASARRVVLRNLGQVVHCYGEQLVRNPRLEGRVVVHFTLAEDGSVARSRMVEGAESLSTIAECFANAVHRWQFPPPVHAPAVTVDVTFDLIAPAVQSPPWHPPLEHYPR